MSASNIAVGSRWPPAGAAAGNNARRGMGVFLPAGLAVLLWATASAGAATNVAVFNFSMKSDTPQWRWLEKGLADRIITDLFRDGRVSVVQRDEMQQVAQRFGWAPELIGDPERLESIRKAVRAKYLISGVYEATGGTLTLTAFVVDFQTSRQVARRTVTGPAGEGLKLTRQLSAALLSWLTRRPAEEVLGELTVWTRSIPAARALYEGIHLYDQGRYGEAWLKFRQASRDDPAYCEAAYWVGRMYYFMDRYEHARRAFERFVYLDSSHPRMGDAIKEYLHTHEKLDAPPETLLALYDGFLRRFPEVKIPREMNVRFPVSARCWLWTRKAQLWAALGRHQQAIELASAAMAEIQEKGEHHFWFSGYAGWACRVATGSALAHNMLTGAVVLPAGLRTNYRRYARSGPDHVLEVRPDSREAVAMEEKPRAISGRRSATGKTLYKGISQYHYVLAPDGHVFTKLTFYPIVDGTDAHATCTLCKDSFWDCGSRRKPLDQARREGLCFEQVPRCGIFRVLLGIAPNDQRRDPKVTFRGLRVLAELEKVSKHGAVRVSCGNTDNFSVLVDGTPGRARPGLIGLLAPGPHRLEFHPAKADYPHGPVEKAVHVEAGRVAEVTASLPWKRQSPWASWTPGTLIGRDYPGQNVCLQRAEDPPSVLADNEAIRVFWSYRGDLWSSVSADGERFSHPAKLPMPISSGWHEQNPVCLRDESGRFVLAFRSDREAQHQRRAFVCWSRDAVHWSRPAMVEDRPVNSFDVIQDDRGRFLWADIWGSQLTILRSVDAYRWEKLAAWTLDDFAVGLCLLQRGDGTYELFVANIRYFTERRDLSSYNTFVWQYVSKDAATWSQRKRVTWVRMEEQANLSAVHVDGRTLVALFRANRYTGHQECVRLARERADGDWDRSPDLLGVVSHCGSMAYHPRWGYMIAWQLRTDDHFPMPLLGPYLIRGRSVQRLLSQNKQGE